MSKDELLESAVCQDTKPYKYSTSPCSKRAKQLGEASNAFGKRKKAL
jgi:hypothetical protein